MEDNLPPEAHLAETFATGIPHIKGIEAFYGLGRRLCTVVAGSSAEFLIQQAFMAFAKAMMSLEAYLRFVPSSSFYVKTQEQLVDVSSVSVMARQVLEDVLSFLYLSEPSLSPEQKQFRQLVWTYHGCTEWIESQTFRDSLHPDLPTTRAMCDQARQDLEKNPLLGALKKDWRGRILKGQEGAILHDREILSRRGIQTKHYDLPRKVLSNFAHFSSFSYVLMNDVKRSELPLFISLLYVARFVAEALEVFLETFPQTRQSVSKTEEDLIAILRAKLRKSSP